VIATSWYCVLDEAGSVLLEQRLSTTPKAMREVFGGMPRSRIALETGMHSPWVSRLLGELGHEVIVAHARNVRLIGESRKKDDRWMRRRWPGWRGSIRSCCAGEASQREGASGSDRDPGTSRTGAARTALVNTARGLAKSLRGAAARLQSAQYESGESGRAESGTATAAGAAAGGCRSAERAHRRIQRTIEQLAQQSYPQVALLKQVKGVGTLIALTYLLTLEDPHRFRKSRDVGCYLGLQPGRRNSGQSEPQLHISKEGDPYLRTLLVQGAHHILGPFGADSDLRRWGLKLAERGGRMERNERSIAVPRESWRCCCIACG
jgi:transposase